VTAEPSSTPSDGVGDPGALAGLLETHLPWLRRWAHGRLAQRARSCADTGDVVQDVFVRVFARLDLFQPRSRRALAAYLRAAVRNRILDEHRRAARWAITEVPDTLPTRERSPLDRTLDAENRRRYRRALATLTPRDRALVVAHLELEFSHAQLGCMIGRSPHAARMALTRAMARLAREVGRG
jgi:RNA polymerase sigma factor (sigma-70 family)